MWWKKNKVSTVPARLGIWPDGEPQSVRDAADRCTGPRGYDVYMVVFGGYDTYDVVGVHEDRHTARHVADVHNAMFGVPGDLTRLARVEETSFYPAGIRASGEGR